MPTDDELFYHGEPDYAGAEKRTFLRVNVNFVVGYYVFPGQVEQRDASCTRNVSAGGVCFTTEAYFAKGTILHISLQLPQVTRLVEFLGEVSFVTQEDKGKQVYDTGVKFVKADEEDLKLLERLIKECAARETRDKFK